jgi:hypothetical protein
MSTTTCTGAPNFSITGDAFFSTTAVTIQVTFSDEGAETTVQAYEWYLDNILLADVSGILFAANVACGQHTAGARILSEGSWSGIQEFKFTTCKAVSAQEINGPATLDQGDSSPYTVIWSFTDGTTADMTASYTFTSGAGGFFAGNVFTAAIDASEGGPFQVTITATMPGQDPLTDIINVIDPTTTAGILVVDLYQDPTLYVIGFVSNPEVTESHVAAHSGMNIIPVGSAAAGALIVTSDCINQPSLYWRFLFNLKRLKTDYPGTASFVFDIKGAGAAGTLNGAYILKNQLAVMEQTGSPGSYEPTTTGGGDLGTDHAFTCLVVENTKNSYNEADLTTMIELTFNVADNTVSYTTGQ